MVKIIGVFTTYIGNDGDARRAQWDKSKVQNGFNPCLWTALLVRYKKHTTSSYYTMAMWVVKISKRVITFNETPRYFLSFVNYWVGNHIIKISCFRNWSFASSKMSQWWNFCAEMMEILSLYPSLGNLTTYIAIIHA